MQLLLSVFADTAAAEKRWTNGSSKLTKNDGNFNSIETVQLQDCRRSRRHKLRPSHVVGFLFVFFVVVIFLKSGGLPQKIYT